MRVTSVFRDTEWIQSTTARRRPPGRYAKGTSYLSPTHHPFIFWSTLEYPFWLNQERRMTYRKQSKSSSLPHCSPQEADSFK